MIECHGKVNQGLQEQPVRSTHGCPEFFEYLVTPEKFAGVVQLDAAEVQRLAGQGHRICCALYHAKVSLNPSSNEKRGACPRSAAAEVVSACESCTSPGRG